MINKIRYKIKNILINIWVKKYIILLFVIFGIIIFYILYKSNIFNNNPDVNWLFLLSNFILVIVTLIYVIFTYNLVKETKKQNKINIMPILAINQEFCNPVYDYVQGQDTKLSFKIINNGNGNAFNIYLKIYCCINMKSDYNFSKKYKNRKTYPINKKIPLKFTNINQMIILSNQIDNYINIDIILDNLLANEIKRHELANDPIGTVYLEKKQTILIIISYSDILHNRYKDQYEVYIKYDKADNMIKYNDQLGIKYLKIS